MVTGAGSSGWEVVAALVMDELDRAAVVIDSDGVIRAANAGLVKLVSRPPEQLVGESFLDTCVPPAAQSTAAWYLQEAARGALRRCELALTGEDEAVAFEVVAVRIGDCTGVLAIQVSERKIEVATPLYPTLVFEAARSGPSFGLVREVVSPSSGYPEQLVGRRCYETLARSDAPCADCPADKLTPGMAPMTCAVHGPPGTSDLFVATMEHAERDRMRVALFRVDEETFTGLLRARAQHVADRASLTEREREVLQYLLVGRTAEEIAVLLGISPRTVRFHQQNLLGKLGAESRVDLMRVVF